MSIPVVDYKPLSDGERRTAREIARKIIAWAEVRGTPCIPSDSRWHIEWPSDDDVKPDFTVG